MHEYDEEISTFKAENYLDFTLNTMGVYIYNQAIADTHEFMQQKTEELFSLEKRVIK